MLYSVLSTLHTINIDRLVRGTRHSTSKSLSLQYNDETGNDCGGLVSAAARNEGVFPVGNYSKIMTPVSIEWLFRRLSQIARDWATAFTQGRNERV
jgi:hypothetical protein